MSLKAAITRHPFGTLVLGIVAVLGLLLSAPTLVFDHSTPGYDRNWEHSEGVEIAWGPKPRAWLIFADPNRSTFTGQEWYFRLFEAHCTEWLQERHMQRPPASKPN